jgi:esterase/lipase superfamily enzyme
MTEQQGRFYADRAWAVQDAKTAHHSWSAQDEFSLLQFNLAGSDQNGLSYCRQVKQGDVILKVKGEKNLLAMGEVVRIEWKEEKVNISIQWINEINAFECSEPVFDPSAELQRVDQYLLDKLNLPVVLKPKHRGVPKMQSAPPGPPVSLDKMLQEPPISGAEPYEMSPPKMGNGGGGSHEGYGGSGAMPEMHENMMESAPPMEDDHTASAAPEEMSAGAAPEMGESATPAPPMPDAADNDHGGKASLFYCTNRKRTKSEDLNKFYGAVLTEPSFGFCEVSIPPGHSQGKIERPANYIIFKMPENDKRHIVVSNIKEKTEKEFFEDIIKDLGAHADRSAFIFVHGYNTTFSEAAWRTAQIAWDIPFKGIAGFFSWPSAGQTIKYLQDIEKADSSIGHLEAFIEKMIVNTQVENVHIIAHSMGNRIATHALNNLSRKPSFAANMQKIKQVVLCAPDLDQTVFNNSILPYFKSIGLRRTLYCSEKDKALAFSEKLRSQPRLGDAGSQLYVTNGIDTIDASNVNSLGNHHSYIFETKEVLTDLHFLLGNNFSPEERKLKSGKKGELPYWLFPDV